MYILQVLIQVMNQSFPCNSVDTHIYLWFLITSWCFPDIYIYKNHFYFMVGQPQWQPYIFQFFLLQQLLINNILVFKLVDIKCCFQNFYWWSWFIALFCMGTCTFKLKTYILFFRWVQCGQFWCGCGGYCITKRGGMAIFMRCLVWLWIFIILAIRITMMVSSLI